MQEDNLINVTHDNFVHRVVSKYFPCSGALTSPHNKYGLWTDQFNKLFNILNNRIDRVIL